MSKAHKRLKRTWMVAFLFLMLASCAEAAVIKGVSFAGQLQVAQTELRLTGVAALKWALLFDVYAGAFYLPEGYAAASWTDDIPKRLELAYFRNFTAEDFSMSSDKLLRDNLPANQYQALAERLQHFYRLFRDIKPGDRYSLTYRSDIGTELRFNDELLGVAPGADFAVAYLGIWLGKQPLDKRFRDRLLGGG